MEHPRTQAEVAIKVPTTASINLISQLNCIIPQRGVVNYEPIYDFFCLNLQLLNMTRRQLSKNKINFVQQYSNRID